MQRTDTPKIRVMARNIVSRTTVADNRPLCDNHVTTQLARNNERSSMNDHQ